MTKSDCGCNKGCNSSDEKKMCLRHLIEPVYDNLPDRIKEMMHSLDKQKLAVVNELKSWAKDNQQEEIVKACDHKIEKINNTTQPILCVKWRRVRIYRLFRLS